MNSPTHNQLNLHLLKDGIGMERDGMRSHEKRREQRRKEKGEGDSDQTGKRR